MSEFFYYGQKDTIQRLNELAGRGAVVASYAPKVGMSPLGGPNGRITPAWLDPTIPIQQSARLGSGPTAKYGYTYLSQGFADPRYILIATFREESDGTYDNLVIRGVINDNWGAGSTAMVDILIGVRGGFFVEWTRSGFSVSQSRFMVIKRTDGKYDVYAYFPAGSFSTISFDLAGIGATTYAEPVVTQQVTSGVVVFDSAVSAGATGYIAPRWTGVSFGGHSRNTRFSSTLFVGSGAINDTFLAAPSVTSIATGGSGLVEPLGLGVIGVSGSSYPGRFGVLTQPTSGVLYKEGYVLSFRAYDIGSNTWTNDLFQVKGNGIVVTPRLRAGPYSLVYDNVSYHVLDVEATSQNADVVVIPGSATFRKSDGGWGNITATSMIVTANTVTNRSINARGTINTSGNDYAEYITKCISCSIVEAGQIVGVTSDNEITDQWSNAVIFAIKSTDPSFVGGDGWAADIGSRPTPKASAEPVKPIRREDVIDIAVRPGTNLPESEEVITEPGDSDEEWESKLVLYGKAMTAWALQVQEDKEAAQLFDAELEIARQKVDRIAIAGRVPVNVLGAQPGDYIVPVQDGAGIEGIAVHEDDLTMKQYLRAVGRVISIEADGRAYVMVKSV